MTDHHQQRPRAHRRPGRRRLGAGLALLLGLLTGMVAFAPSAFAHHPEITATGTCEGTVSYTARSWSTGYAGSHPQIHVEWRIGTSGDWTAVTSDDAVDYFKDAPGTSGTPGDEQLSFTGSFAPGTTSDVYVRVRASSAKWGDWWDATPYSAYGTGGGEVWPGSGGTKVSFPTGCTPPADPSAQATVVCAEQEIRLSFTGQHAATTVDIRKDGVLVANDHPVPVGPSTYDLPLGPGDENDTVAVSLDYAVGTDQNLNVPVDCVTPAAPGAQISWACGADVTVNLTNTGQEAVEATIWKNGVAVQSGIAVPAGGNVARTVAVTGADEDTTMTIKVTFSDAGTATDVTKTYEVDCDQPVPVVSGPVCAQGGVAFTLGNTGDDDATFTVASPALAANPTVVVLGPGGSFQILIPLAEGATTSVAISADGEPLYSNQALTRDCEKPAVVSAVLDCAQGGVVVSLSNTGNQPTTVTVAGTPVVVPAGGPASHLVEVAENASYSIVVTGDGLNQTFTGKRDCEQPAATLVFDCAEGGVEVVLGNTGTVPTTITVAGVPHEIGPGGTKTVVVPVAEGAEYDVVVTGDQLSKKLTGTRDCEQPAVVSAVLDCAQGGVVVSLTNTGELPATVVVAGDEVVVPAEGSTTHLVPVAENADYSIPVTGEDIDQTFTGTRDCEQPAATLVFDCAEGGVEVVLGNTGTVPTTITVAGVPHEIGPGGTKTVVVPVAEGAGYDVVVTGDQLSKKLTGTRDCEQPAVVSAVLDCAQGGVVVSLTNTGELPATVVVAGDEVVVPAEGSTTHLVPVAENADYSIPVTGEGIDQTFTGTRNCEQPAVASAVLDCAEGGVVVTLTNDGVSPTTVTVAGTPVVVPAGGSASHLVPVAENADYSITVTGDELEETFTGTRDCEQPQVDGVVVECAEGGVVVTLSNPGASDTVVTVDGVEVTIPAGGTVGVLVPVAEDAAYDIDVVGDELEQTLTGVLDCLQPEPSVDPSPRCATGGVVITLRNTGDDDATFVVTSPALDSPVTVVLAPGATQDVLIPLAEDASTTVRVTAEGVVVREDTITRDCNDVAGERIDRTPQVAGAALPRTGVTVSGLVAAGLGLLLAGLALVRPARRRTA